MRVTLCCAALGGLIGVCLAFVSEQISEHYEQLLIREEMNAELDMQITQEGANAGRRLPHSAWKSLYIDRPGQPPTSPVALRALSPGVHELDSEDSDRFAAVRAAPIGRVTLIASLPDSPARDMRFAEALFAMVVLGVVLGAWLGRLLAGSMLAPVLRLAHDVDSVEPGAVWQRIAADHHADEVGVLANALIRYRTRMRAAVEREILFSADASHELRTPLTVLQGALDLMRESAGANGAGRGRLERMRHSADEMATLLDALLLIARPAETTDFMTVVELGPALASVVAEFRMQLDAAQIVLVLRCADAARFRAPADVLRVALRLLFRSIVSGALGDRLRLDADAQGIVLAPATDARDAPPVRADDGESSSGGTTPVRRSDETGGLGMLRRLCRRYGWALELGGDPVQAILLTLRFWSPEVSAEFKATGARMPPMQNRAI